MGRIEQRREQRAVRSPSRQPHFVVGPLCAPRRLRCAAVAWTRCRAYEDRRSRSRRTTAMLAARAADHDDDARYGFDNALRSAMTTVSAHCLAQGKAPPRPFRIVRRHRGDSNSSSAGPSRMPSSGAMAKTADRLIRLRCVSLRRPGPPASRRRCRHAGTARRSGDARREPVPAHRSQPKGDRPRFGAGRRQPAFLDVRSASIVGPLATRRRARIAVVAATGAGSISAMIVSQNATGDGCARTCSRINCRITASTSTRTT